MSQPRPQLAQRGLNDFWDHSPERLTYYRGADEQRRPGDPSVVFAQTAYRVVMTHLASDTSRELGGLLLGRFDRARNTVHVERALPARHIESTPVRLTFKMESWAEFDRHEEQLRAQGFAVQRVGWYHSHPHMSIFLSSYDLDVCESFRQPYHVALVVDPVKPKGGFFVHGALGYRPSGPQGFWEQRDLESKSLVTWHYVKADPAATTPALVATTAAAGAPARPLRIGFRQPQPTVVEPPRPIPEYAAPPSRGDELDHRGITFAALCLLGVVALGVWVLGRMQRTGDADA